MVGVCSKAEKLSPSHVPPLSKLPKHSTSRQEVTNLINARNESAAAAAAQGAGGRLQVLTAPKEDAEEKKKLKKGQKKGAAAAAAGVKDAEGKMEA